ncbi:hypothetical protein BG004_001984 [Podila humilis]|nr:hypothetical protein BG004_001984 [Podila humilis]
MDDTASLKSARSRTPSPIISIANPSPDVRGNSPKAQRRHGSPEASSRAAKQRTLLSEEQRPMNEHPMAANMHYFSAVPTQSSFGLALMDPRDPYLNPPRRGRPPGTGHDTQTRESTRKKRQRSLVCAETSSKKQAQILSTSRGIQQKETNEKEDVYQGSYAEVLLLYFASESAPIPSILIKPPPDLDFNIIIDAEGHTPLHWAVSNAMLKVVQLLVQHGADVLRVNNLGQTPLMRSVLFTKNFDNMTFPVLLDMLQKTIFTIDNNDQTVFHHVACASGIRGKGHAAQYYMECLIEKLSKHPTELASIINVQDLEGDTALTIAARSNHKMVVNLLQNAGADGDIRNKAGQNANEILQETATTLSGVPSSPSSSSPSSMNINATDNLLHPTSQPTFSPSTTPTIKNASITNTSTQKVTYYQQKLSATKSPGTGSIHSGSNESSNRIAQQYLPRDNQGDFGSEETDALLSDSYSPSGYHPMASTSRMHGRSSSGSLTRPSGSSSNYSNNRMSDLAAPRLQHHGGHSRHHSAHVYNPLSSSAPSSSLHLQARQNHGPSPGSNLGPDYGKSREHDFDNYLDVDRRFDSRSPYLRGEGGGGGGGPDSYMRSPAPSSRSGERGYESSSYANQGRGEPLYGHYDNYSRRNREEHQHHPNYSHHGYQRQEQQQQGHHRHQQPSLSEFSGHRSTRPAAQKIIPVVAELFEQLAQSYESDLHDKEQDVIEARNLLHGIQEEVKEGQKAVEVWRVKSVKLGQAEKRIERLQELLHQEIQLQQRLRMEETIMQVEGEAKMEPEDGEQRTEEDDNIEDGSKRCIEMEKEAAELRESLAQLKERRRVQIARLAYLKGTHGKRQQEYKRLIALCCNVSIDEVDGLLEPLVQAMKADDAPMKEQLEAEESAAGV